MAEPIPAKQTLIPQFTIRQLFIVTAGCSIVFLVGAQAYRGALWAVAASVGVLAIPAILMVHAAMFAVVWFAYQIYERRQRRASRTTDPAQPTTQPRS